MKKILISILLVAAVGCSPKEEEKAPEPKTESTASEYYAEYGIPDQNLITPCSGEKDLVRPVTKCVKRSTNSLVNNALCYTLAPIYMTIPSPSGERQTSITGGTRLDSCEEGSTDILATSYVCSMGFFLLNGRCQSYETVGSYAIPKDQIYHEKNGLKILMTLGNDHSVKESGPLKMIMLLE